MLLPSSKQIERVTSFFENPGASVLISLISSTIVWQERFEPGPTSGVHQNETAEKRPVAPGDAGSSLLSALAQGLWVFVH